MTYTVYDDYKESEIHWAMKIPKHWKVSKLKRIFKFEKGKNSNVLTEEYVKSNEGPYPVYSGQTKNNGVLGSIDSYEYDFKNNIILVTTVGAKAMTTFLINGKLSLSQNCALIKLKSSDDFSDYYYYLCKILFDYERGLIPDILQPSLRIGDLNTYNIIKPPLDEQKQIANYLDKETSKIDETIAKNEELIQLLEEKRIALINQVVTKGLNSDVPMKDSGIELIGVIPKHWDKTKIRFLGTLQNGISKSSEYFGHGYPFISYGDVYNNDEIPDVINGKSETTISERVVYSVQKNDIFFTRTSETTDEVGITSLCTKTIENGTFSGFLIRFRLFKNIDINVNFLKFYLQSIAIRHYFAKMMVIVTRASLGQNLLNNLNILLPPMDEQKQIADYLDKETSIIDKTIEKIKVNINLLEEYKTSLIHHVVTGKVDVRYEV